MIALLKKKPHFRSNQLEFSVNLAKRTCKFRRELFFSLTCLLHTVVGVAREPVWACAEKRSLSVDADSVSKTTVTSLDTLVDVLAHHPIGEPAVATNTRVATVGVRAVGGGRAAVRAQLALVDVRALGAVSIVAFSTLAME